MKYIKNHFIFESKNDKKYSSKSLVFEICTSMVLLNSNFLDNILDRGLKARYSENSQVFLNDLKNLLISKNRLSLGQFVNNECVDDDNLSKLNTMFDSIEFDIENDWNILVDSRNTARSIIDKLLQNEKLSSDRINKIYWIGPNKDSDHNEDIVLELKDGNQYSFFLNKNLTTQKTSSFNLFADEIIGDDLDSLYNEENIRKWDKLTQEWVSILYENANKKIQAHIEKFIDVKRINSIGYFEYFDIRHQDPKFKYLGEYIGDFGKNILKFSDLMNEIWKNKEICFMDIPKVSREWSEVKMVILNSRILENIFTTSLRKTDSTDIKRLDDGFKTAEKRVKMKFIKTIVEKLGCLERPIYFVSNGGNSFYQLPSRKFFRDNYSDLVIKFDYHVKFIVKDDEDGNDFKIRIRLEIDNQHLLGMDVIIKFSGSEFSGKLSAKYKFEIPSNFNYLVSTYEN